LAISQLREPSLFVGIVIFVDVFVVALFIEQSLAMFASFIGTWLPLALIFMATYLKGTHRENI
jgi:hypothetical protein